MTRRKAIGLAMLAAVATRPAAGQTEQQKLTFGAAGTEAWMGYAVAIENDVAVAATREGGDASYVVFRRNGSVWSQEAVLQPPIQMLKLLDDTVVVDGDVIVAGAPGRGPDIGHAFIYRHDGAVWLSELTASNGVGGFFGDAVAASGDIVAIADWAFDTEPLTANGTVYLYRYDPLLPGWSLEQRVEAADAADADIFGFGVALDGDTLIVGAPFDDDLGTSTGGVYIFEHDGESWVQRQKLGALDAAAGDEFGYAVDIRGDRAVVGAPAKGVGAAYVFERDATGSWAQAGKLAPVNATGIARFGDAVAVDGSSAIIGAPESLDTGTTSGTAFLFQNDGLSWVQISQFAAGDTATGDHFGRAAAISGDTAIIGSPFNDNSATDAGAAYLFTDVGLTDCNANGIDDAIDIDTGTSTDANDNGVPDECEVTGDADKNGTVDIDDLLMLLAAWGPCPAPCATDFNADGKTDIEDLLMQLASWSPLPPANDQLADAEPIGDGTHEFDNTNATDDGPTDCSGLTRDVWFCYEASCDGIATISLCNSSFDTALAVYDGCQDASVLLACGDDECGMQSEVTTAVSAGQQLLIRVGGQGENAGTGALSVTCAPIVDDPDFCETPEIVGLGDTFFSTLDATLDGPLLPESCDVGNGVTFGPDLWFLYTPEASGVLTVSTCLQADYDTRLAAYVGSCRGLEIVACNDDGPGCGLTSQMSFDVTVGVSVRIRVGGFDLPDVGTGTLTLSMGTALKSVTESRSLPANRSTRSYEDLLDRLRNWPARQQ